MKKFALLFSLLLPCLCGCYHDMQETLNCPWLTLPDSVRVQGLGRYYNKTIDIDWLNNEIPPDSVESFITKIVPGNYSSAAISAKDKAKIIAEVTDKSVGKWAEYKKKLTGDCRIAYYHKGWMYGGSVSGIVIIKGCTIIGDINFPEEKYRAK
jgi:hypothetical protein